MRGSRFELAHAFNGRRYAMTSFYSTQPDPRLGSASSSSVSHFEPQGLLLPEKEPDGRLAQGTYLGDHTCTLGRPFAMPYLVLGTGS